MTNDSTNDRAADSEAPEIDEPSLEEATPEGSGEIAVATAQPLSSRTNRLSFYSGEALRLEEANELAHNLPTRLVMLAGAADSGKTTMIAELFNAFQRGPVNGVSFVGCQGMIGFERRCFLSRLDSNNAVADTERTKFVQPEFFLPLTVRHGSQRVLQLLVADLAGEHFRRAVDTAEAAGELPFVRRADFITLTLDGAKISKGQERLRVKADAFRLLERFREQNLLGSGTSLQLVTTKDDVVSNADDKHRTREFLSGLQDEAKRRFAKSFRSIESFWIASRQTQHEGLGRLIQSWTTLPDPVPATSSTLLTSSRQMGRYIDRGTQEA